MKNEKLYDGITDIRDETLRRAENVPLRAKKNPVRRWGLLAAAAVLIVGCGLFAFRQLLPGGYGVGYTSGSTGAIAGSGGTGSTDSNTGGKGSGDPASPEDFEYMDYQGPILPLMLSEPVSGVSAERQTTLDFAPYETRTEEWTDANGEQRIYTTSDQAVLVTDSYTLKNADAEDKTFTVFYPFAGDFHLSADACPSVAVNSQTIETELTAGSYSGGFLDAEGNETAGTDRFNLLQLGSCQAYRELLGGDYLSHTLDTVPELTETVKVYRFYDFDAPIADEKNPNPSLQAAYVLDYGKTKIITFGSNGGGDDYDSGSGYRVVGGLGRTNGHSDEMLLIVVGEDIQDLRTQGFINSGCHPGDEIEVGCRMEVKEAILGDVLRELTGRYFAHTDPEEGPQLADTQDGELLYAATVDTLLRYGILNDDPAERYSFGMLEELLTDVTSMKRVFLLRFEVTVPAGGETEITLEMRKEASVSFMNDYTNGFDLLWDPVNLPLSERGLELRNTGLVTIVDDSFDSALQEGVQLLPNAAAEHLWLKVIKAN